MLFRNPVFHLLAGFSFGQQAGFHLIPQEQDCCGLGYIQFGFNILADNLPLLLSLRSRGNLPLERSEKENGSASETKEWESYPIQEFRVYPRLLFRPKGSNDKTVDTDANSGSRICINVLFMRIPSEELDKIWIVLYNEYEHMFHIIKEEIY